MNRNLSFAGASAILLASIACMIAAAKKPTPMHSRRQLMQWQRRAAARRKSSIEAVGRQSLAARGWTPRLLTREDS
jgi:hypothetical protein